MQIPDYELSSFPPPIRWHTIKLKVDEPVFGYVAGRGIPAKVHQIANASRPCVYWLSEEQVFCPYCEAKDLQDKVYLPMYLEPTWDRKVVIVSKTAWDHVRHFDYLTRFKAEKNKEPGQPNIFVRERRPDGREPPPHHVREGGPHCIKEYLNHLWGLTARAAWKPQKKKPAAASKPAAQPGTLTPPPDAVTKEQYREKMDAYRRNFGKIDEAA